MKVYEAVTTRRTIRRFKQQAIDEVVLEQIVIQRLLLKQTVKWVLVSPILGANLQFLVLLFPFLTGGLELTTSCLLVALLIVLVLQPKLPQELEAQPLLLVALQLVIYCLL